MKIVVTGALGHIGSKLVRSLPVSIPDCRIVMVDNLSTQRYPALFNLPDTGHYEFVEADVTSDDLSRVISGANVVIHLAAVTDAAGSFNKQHEVERVNLGGTERVARSCAALDAALITISSTSVYGTQKTRVDETCGPEDLQPQSPYAECKLAEESLVVALGKTDGLRFAVPRFGTIFGVSPGMRFHTAVNKFCWQAAMRRPLTVWTTAYDQMRPYLDLNDAISAIVHIIDKSLFDNRIYNVLTLNATVREIIEEIRTHVPTLEVEFVDTKIMNQLSYEVDDSRFRKAGFVAQGSLAQGIGETIALLTNAQSPLDLPQ